MTDRLIREGKLFRRKLFRVYILMPTPPKKGETKESFISRCMKYMRDNNEFKENTAQQSAVCYSVWKKAHPSSKASLLEDINNELVAQADGTIKLNGKAVSNAHEKIFAGKVTGFEVGSWEVNNKKLADAGTLNEWCLGVRTSKADPTKQADWGYPISNDGKNVHVRGIIAAESRALQQGQKAIATAAHDLLDAISKKYKDKLKD